jgi:hypothetical protein
MRRFRREAAPASGDLALPGCSGGFADDQFDGQHLGPCRAWAAASLGGRAGPGAQRVGIADRTYFGPADQAARADLAARYPEAWARMGRRREFMADQLGIRLRPEVLPLSNLAGYLPPYWLAPGLAMRKR